jgi:hypothetical protein
MTGGVAWQWQPGRWQRVVRLVSEPGRAMPIWASSDRAGSRPGWEFLPGYDVIEAFCVTGLAGRAPATRGTYRSALYQLAAAVHGPPGQRATPFAGAKAPPDVRISDLAI